MKKILLYLVALVGALSTAMGQTTNSVGINTNNVDASARLQIDATNRGILIPRVALTGANDNTTINSPASGLLIWNTSSSGGLTPGFYYNTGTTSSPVWAIFVNENSLLGYINDLSAGAGFSTFTYDGSIPVTVNLSDVLVNSGTFGSSTQSPVITVNSKGQVTTASSTSITAIPGGAAGGDLAGSYANPSVDGLQNRTVTSTVPSDGMSLKWNGTAWIPAYTGISTGTIFMWSGTQANIPSGWLLCDGSNGTPDLRDRFILDVTSSYDINTTGGAHTINLNVNQLPSHNHSGSVDAGGSSTPSGTISSDAAGTPSGTINSVSGGTSSGTISSVSAGTPSGSISSTNIDHTHDWGGWWSNDNATDVNNGNGDGTQNTYSDNSRGIYGWNGSNGATVASTASWVGDHSHYLQGRSSGSGWGWPLGVNGGSWGSAGNSNGAGGHNHTTWADVPSHRHFIRQRATYGMSANASHSHTFSGSALGTHNHTFSGSALGTHTHSFTGSALAGHSHSFTGNAVSAHSHTFTTSTIGTGSSIDNRPSFYKLAFIMKQ